MSHPFTAHPEKDPRTGASLPQSHDVALQGLTRAQRLPCGSAPLSSLHNTKGSPAMLTPRRVPAQVPLSLRDLLSEVRHADTHPL